LPEVHCVGVRGNAGHHEVLALPNDTLTGAAIGFVRSPYSGSLTERRDWCPIYDSGDWWRSWPSGGFVVIPAVFVMFLATWTSTDKHLYEESLSLSTTDSRHPAPLAGTVTALAGGRPTTQACMSMVGIFDHLVIMLHSSGCHSPIGGSVCGGFLGLRGRPYLDPDLPPTVIPGCAVRRLGNRSRPGLATMRSLPWSRAVRD